MTTGGEEFSPGMQQLLAGRERRLGARIAATQQQEEEQHRQEEEQRQQNVALVADGQKAAELAAEKNVRPDVTVEFDDGPIACWRLQSQDLHEIIQEMVGGYYDRVQGADIPPHYEGIDRVTGTDEMLLIPRVGLWVVQHHAYMANRLRHGIPHDTIVDARPCSDTYIGGRYADVATRALFNFLDNNKLVPYEIPHEGANASGSPELTPVPSLRAVWSASRPADRIMEMRKHTLRSVEVGVADMVRDVGRLAVWAVEQLQGNNAGPDIVIDAVLRRSSVLHAGGTHDVKRQTIATGWKLWAIPKDKRAWALLPDARVIKYWPEGDKGVILNRDPEEVTLDFNTGDINDGAYKPLSSINANEEEVLTLLSLCGEDVPSSSDAHLLVNRLYPDIGKSIARARAAVGWEDAFKAFVARKGLQAPPPDL